MTTDQAAASPTGSPPALQAVGPEAEPGTGQGVPQTIERDHQHLTGRIHCLRGFETDATAQVGCSGHGFMPGTHAWVLRDGFYTLGVVMGDLRIPAHRG